jgi:hypothetical protein
MLLLLVAFLAESRAVASAEDALESQHIGLLSEPVNIPLSNQFSSQSLDEVTDVIYSIAGGLGLPTTRRFSAVYSDLLYDRRLLVGRLDYPEEEAEVAAAGNEMFLNWRRETHRRGASVWKPSMSLETGGRNCLKKAGTEQLRYNSTIRLYDTVVDFDCVTKSAPSALSARLQVFMRELEHSNALIVHGAQERYLSSFFARQRHSYSVTSSRAFKFSPASVPIDVTYDQVIVQRGWLDETFWGLSRNNGARFLRNEFLYNVGGDTLRTGALCVVREVSLICTASGADKVCRIDNAYCEPIPREMVN